VSRRHCRISYNAQEDDYTIINDSLNGTWLSTGEKLEKGKAYHIKRGTGFFVNDKNEFVQFIDFVLGVKTILHPVDSDDVILDIENDIYHCYNTIREQVENIDIYNNMSILIDMIGEYIQLDRKYLKVIINTNCFNRITLTLKELLYEIVVDNFTKFGHMRLDDEFMLNISMFTGGLVFAYRDWINRLDMKFEVLEKYVKNVSDHIFKKSNN